MSKGTIRVWVWRTIALCGAALIASWFFLRGTAPSPPPASVAAGLAPASAPAVLASSPEGAAVPASEPAAAAPDSPPQARHGAAKPITPEARRLRARVLDSLRSRQQEQPSAPITSAKGPVPGSTPGTMVDRTGELSPQAMHVLNHEFMPLVDVCLDQAHERNPRLHGMLAVGLALAGSKEVGGIIEGVEASAGINQLQDDELIECVRQSAFSIQLPEPIASGRTSLQLTIPFGDPVDAGH